MSKKYIFPVGCILALLQTRLYFSEKKITKFVINAINEVDIDNITELVENSEYRQDAVGGTSEGNLQTATNTFAPSIKLQDDYDNRDSPITTTKVVDVSALEKERRYYAHHYQQISTLVNESSLLDWNRDRRKRGKYQPFLENFDFYHLGMSTTEDISNVDKFFFRSEATLCHIAKIFQNYHTEHPNKTKPHILLARLNQDFGALSSKIKGKTGRFRTLPNDWIREGCTEQFVMDYIHHPDTLAIFTTQFQKWNIPKVISIPLGLSAGGHGELLTQMKIQMPAKNRTQLLMINNKPTAGRWESIRKVMENFQQYGAPQNTYNNYDNTACPFLPPNQNIVPCYFWEMRHSKFVLSPSGLGVDCYRNYEAMYMGAIPVIERLSKTDGWGENTLADLPIAWVDDYKDLTPEYLEKEYDRLVHKTPPKAYKFEKLTRQYWIQLAHSIIDDHVKKAGENGTRWNDQPRRDAPVKEVSSLEAIVSQESSLVAESTNNSAYVKGKEENERANEKSGNNTRNESQLVELVAEERQSFREENLTTIFHPLLRSEEKEHFFYEHHFQRINALVNDSTLMDWNRHRKKRGKYHAFLENFDFHKLGNVDEDIANVDKFFFRNDATLCHTAYIFHKYRTEHPNKPKPHILLARLNQDFGALSSAIKGKTGKFQKLPFDWNKQGCSEEFVMDYIHHPDTLAIFTNQFQQWNISKVISIPLGLHAGGHGILMRQMGMYSPARNRTQLLMVNSQPWAGRKKSINEIEENFKDHGTRNTYHNYQSTDCPYDAASDVKSCYYWEMRKSKFLLSPIGLGVDCYRTWEALYLGAIPVLERVWRTEDGWFINTLADLPVAWIDDYKDLTPQYLEKEYHRIVHQTPPNAYKFEKLTRQYWIQLAYSILEDHKRKASDQGSDTN